MLIFVQSVLPNCEPFPGRCSVIVMDNAPIHMKPLIEVECARVGVIVLFLPPYGYVLNPVELVFNSGRARMQRMYGAAEMDWPVGRTIGDIFVESCFNCVTPTIACNFFQNCGIPISIDDRAWANR